MTKPKILPVCLLATLLALLTGCQTPPRPNEAQARDSEVQTRDNGAQSRASEVQARTSEARARDRQHKAGVAFSEGDDASIRDFYKQGHQPDNPPGKITELHRGGPYPFGYTWLSLPKDLEDRLSPLPNGFIRIIVGNDVGILDIRTRVVVDLLENLYVETQVRDNKVPVTERKARAREHQVQVHASKAQASEVKVQAVQVSARPNEGGAVFSEDDIASIRDFYKRGHQPGLTAGRITKLQRGEAYPFGYTWRPLPSDLENSLSPLPSGYIRVLVGTEIGILDIRTRVVADVLEDLAA